MAINPTLTTGRYTQPQQEPRSGWLSRTLKKAVTEVIRAVSSPQISHQSRSQSTDTYSAVGGREVTSSRSLGKLTSTGRNGRSNSFTDQQYLAFCDEIGNYPEASASPPVNQTRRA